MSLLLQIIQPSEIEEILEFELKKLSETISDETERTFQSWKSRWRRESLEHYLPMGWSFIARDENFRSETHPKGPMVGYFIAQPLLFLDGQTQSLWIEHLQYNSLQVRDELCDLAYKLSREKHLQKVYFPKTPSVENSVRSLKPEDWNPQALALKTTRTNQ